MTSVFVENLNLWQFENLAKESGVRHFVTDRRSPDIRKELTLSYSSVPDREEVRLNRRYVAAAMGISEERLYLPSQVHKTHIANVTRDTTKEALLETDALITNKSGLCIAVMSADCVPILLYDKKNNAIAAIHAGWRGTVARIVEKTVQTLAQKFGTRGEDVVAGIGPSVSQDSYEVGTEVVQEVQRAFSKSERLLLHQHDGKAKFDLWEANKMQLLEFGIPDTSIEISDLCTVKNNQHFFSARKGDSGRFAAGIVLS